MSDRYAGWTEEPADEHAGWTEEPAEPAPRPSRAQRLLEAVKAAPGQAARFGKRVVDYQMRAGAHPVDTIKDLVNLEQGGTGDAIVRGFGKGASAGFVDELDGAVGAVSEAGQTILNPEDGPLLRRAAGGGNPLIAAYRAHRDQRQIDDKAAQQGSPDAFGVSQLAGAAAMPAAKAKLAGRLAQGAGQGAAYGLGESSADLTKGEVVPALRDTAEGAVTGLAAAGVVEPVAALGRYSSALKAKGHAGEVAAVGKAASKDFGSARGGLGSDTRQALTSLEKADAIIASPLATPEMKAQAQGFLDSELGKQTRLLAWQNTLDDLPNRMSQMQEGRASMDAAASASAPEAVEAAAKQNLQKSVLKEDIAPRVDRLVGNKALSMIGQFGGAPITTTKNLLKTPRVQYRTGQIGEAVSTPATVVGKTLQPGAAQTFEDYLRPRTEEDERKKGEHFAKMTGR